MNEGAIGAAECQGQSSQEGAWLNLEGELVSEIVLALTKSNFALLFSRTQRDFLL